MNLSQYQVSPCAASSALQQNGYDINRTLHGAFRIIIGPSPPAVFTSRFDDDEYDDKRVLYLGQLCAGQKGGVTVQLEPMEIPFARLYKVRAAAQGSNVTDIADGAPTNILGWGSGGDIK
ncbi:hypothetical protein Bbelb_272470 [Branchiostoma belcheri]|nr:hypothetical protein Bbelb_272470 [Branchiostoma belcheri]